MDLLPGEYEVISTVTIRREPRIVEVKDDRGNIQTNAVGRLTVGTHRNVFSIITDKYNASWGRISEADAAGIAQWICLQNTNRMFAKPIKFFSETPAPSNYEMRLAALEARVKVLEDLLNKA